MVSIEYEKVLVDSLCATLIRGQRRYPTRSGARVPARRGACGATIATSSSASSMTAERSRATIARSRSTRVRAGIRDAHRARRIPRRSRERSSIHPRLSRVVAVGAPGAVHSTCRSTARSRACGIGGRRAPGRHSFRRRTLRGRDACSPPSRFRRDGRSHCTSARGEAPHRLMSIKPAASCVFGYVVNGLQFRGRLRDAERLTSLAAHDLRPAALYNLARFGMVPKDRHAPSSIEFSLSRREHASPSYLPGGRPTATRRRSRRTSMDSRHRTFARPRH